MAETVQKMATQAVPEHEEDTIPASRELNGRSTLALLGGALAFFCSSGFVNAFGVFLEYYKKHQLRNKSTFDITWIGAIISFLMFLSAAPAGLLLDKAGPTLLLIGGSIGTLLAIFITSLCTEYYQFFLAQGALLGMSLGFLFLPALATIPRYFIRHRGLALGIVVSGSSLGGVIWPIMLDQLLNTHGISFGWTLRVVGFTMLPLLSIMCFTLRPPAKVPKDKGDATEGVHLPKSHKMDMSIFKNLTFLAMCAGMTICFLGFLTPFFFVTSYATSVGHSARISFYLVSILSGASTFGRILPGYLADRCGKFNTIIVFSLLAGATALCWTAARSITALIIWSLAYGFNSGAILSLQAACAAQLSTPKTHGTVMGMAMGLVALAGLFGLPISGELVTHGYFAVSMYTGACLLLGTMFVVWSRVQQDHRLFAVV